jgi:hypothetical protein
MAAAQHDRGIAVLDDVRSPEAGVTMSMRLPFVPATQKSTARPDGT